VAPGSDPTDDPDLVLVVALLARVLERVSPDLTLTQYRLLALIASGEERASHIANRLALTKPTVSATIDVFVERGFVAREQVEGDRRATRLTLTPDGLAILHAAGTAMHERLDDVLAHCDTAEDRDTVVRGLVILRDALAARRAERLEAQLASEAGSS
jgi:DNA-binding MarR family transcriptional regulator